MSHWLACVLGSPWTPTHIRIFCENWDATNAMFELLNHSEFHVQNLRMNLDEFPWIFEFHFTEMESTKTGFNIKVIADEHKNGIETISFLSIESQKLDRNGFRMHGMTLNVSNRFLINPKGTWIWVNKNVCFRLFSLTFTLEKSIERAPMKWRSIQHCVCRHNNRLYIHPSNRLSIVILLFRIGRFSALCFVGG